MRNEVFHKGTNEQILQALREGATSNYSNVFSEREESAANDANSTDAYMRVTAVDLLSNCELEYTENNDTSALVTLIYGPDSEKFFADLGTLL